jgi:UDP-N-acetylmuramate dehydrogenase
MNDSQQRELAARWPDKIRWDVAMAEHCTLRAGGRAAGLADVTTTDELEKLLADLAELGIAGRVIGRGSNILVTDSGYPGVLIRLTGDFREVTSLAETTIRVGGGCSMSGLLAWCVDNDLAGLEFMAGIPGSVGGAVRMNAGAWGRSIGELVEEIACVDRGGHARRFDAVELQFSYRSLVLRHGEIADMVIVAAVLQLVPGTGAEIKKQSQDYIAQRKGKQPAGVASAGSFFKNPAGDSAGRLIEAAGLKGTSVGKAMVSPVHANFIVNTGGASASDILELMELVQDRVYRRFAVRLEPEVKIIKGS